MVEFFEGKIGQGERGISDRERGEWDIFVFVVGLHDASWLDELSSFVHNLQFSWSSASHGSLSLSKLYTFYVGQWS